MQTFAIAKGTKKQHPSRPSDEGLGRKTSEVTVSPPFECLVSPGRSVKQKSKKNATTRLHLGTQRTTLSQRITPLNVREPAEDDGALLSSRDLAQKWQPIMKPKNQNSTGSQSSRKSRSTHRAQHPIEASQEEPCRPSTNVQSLSGKKLSLSKQRTINYQTLGSVLAQVKRASNGRPSKASLGDNFGSRADFTKSMTFMRSSKKTNGNLTVAQTTPVSNSAIVETLKKGSRTSGKETKRKIKITRVDSDSLEKHLIKPLKTTLASETKQQLVSPGQQIKRNRRFLQHVEMKSDLSKKSASHQSVLTSSTNQLIRTQPFSTTQENRKTLKRGADVEEGQTDSSQQSLSNMGGSVLESHRSTNIKIKKMPLNQTTVQQAQDYFDDKSIIFADQASCSEAVGPNCGGGSESRKSERIQDFSTIRDGTPQKIFIRDEDQSGNTPSMMPVKVKSEVVVLSSSSALPRKHKSKMTPLDTSSKDYSFKLVTPTSAGPGGANQPPGFYVPPGSLTPVNEPNKLAGGGSGAGGQSIFCLKLQQKLVTQQARQLLNQASELLSTEQSFSLGEKSKLLTIHSKLGQIVSELRQPTRVVQSNEIVILDKFMIDSKRYLSQLRENGKNCSEIATAKTTTALDNESQLTATVTSTRTFKTERIRSDRLRKIAAQLSNPDKSESWQRLEQLASPRPVQTNVKQPSPPQEQPSVPTMADSGQRSDEMRQSLGQIEETPNTSAYVGMFAQLTPHASILEEIFQEGEVKSKPSSPLKGPRQLGMKESESTMSDTINKAIVDSKLSNGERSNSDCVSVQLEQIKKEIQNLARESKLCGISQRVEDVEQGERVLGSQLQIILDQQKKLLDSYYDLDSRYKDVAQENCKLRTEYETLKRRVSLEEMDSVVDFSRSESQLDF